MNAISNLKSTSIEKWEGVFQEYIDEYNWSLNVVVLEDHLTEEQLISFSEKLLILKEQGLDFIIFLNSVNSLCWLTNDDMELEDIYDLELGVINQHGLKVSSILYKNKVKTSLILWSKWEAGYFNSEYQLWEIDSELIHKELQLGKTPIILPIINNWGNLVPVDAIKVATDTSIKLWAMKLIIPTSNREAISNFSMLSLSEARSILKEWKLGHILKSYLWSMVHFVESNKTDSRAHFIPLPADVLNEITTIEWAKNSTMISSHEFHTIDLEKDVYAHWTVERV